MDVMRLIKKAYVDQIPRPQNSVGVEIELPLVSMQKLPVERSFIVELAKQIEQMGFSPARSTLDGLSCEWTDKAGDVCSFETTWNTLELSMKNTASLTTIAARFYALLMDLEKFSMARGYYLCGRGIHPNCARIDASPLQTPILLAKSKFLKRYTSHHDGEIFHAICASAQTHFNAVCLEQYLEYFNLFRRAYVFDGLFFANSLPPPDELLGNREALRDSNPATLCFRDELWRLCGAPNTTAVPGDILDEESLCRYLAQLKFFIVPEGNGFSPISPVSVKQYFQQDACSEQALGCLRSLEPVAPTQRGTLELRSVCTQPLDELFAPSAFYLGLAERTAEARRYTDDIYRRIFSGSTPAEVRTRLMHRSGETLRQLMAEDGLHLLEISMKGLRDRNFGEEIFLLPLYRRLEQKDILLPAQRAGADSEAETRNQITRVKEMYL